MIFIMILVTDPMQIRLGFLAIRNRGASFSNFPFVNTGN